MATKKQPAKAKKGDSTKKVVGKHCETKEEARLLKVILPDSEVSQLGRDLAEQHMKRDQIEADKKEVVDEYKARISACDTQIKRLSDIVNQGSEMRDVPCKILKDYVKGILIVTRLDTKKQVEKRKLSEEECQMGLKLRGENNKKKIEIGKELIVEAVKIIKETKRASVSSLQRRLKVGYTQAANIMDKLEADGIVGSPRGSDPREILIDVDDKTDGKKSDEAEGKK